MRGLEVRKNAGNGYTVIQLHYLADPFKDEEWASVERAKWPNPNLWKRMYEIDFAGVEGTPIHPTFDRPVHVKKLTFNPAKPVLRGWDFGRTSSVIFCQQDSRDRIVVLKEFVKNNVDYYRHFVQEVLEFCKESFEPLEDKDGNLIPVQYEDFSDYAGRSSSDTKEKAYTEILADFEIYSLDTPFGKTTKDRAIEFVNRLLNQKITIDSGETRGLLIDESCKILIDGFCGAYVYDDRGRPKALNHPYEDIHDALHYVMINKFTLIKEKVYDYSNWQMPKINPITGYYQ